MQNKLQYNKILQKKDSELIDFFKELHGSLSINEKDETLEIDLSILNFMATNENSIKIVFDSLNFKILAMTKNVDTVLGLSQENIQDFSYITTLFVPEHLLFIANHIESQQKFMNPERLKGYSNFATALCGIKITDLDGKSNRLLIRCTPSDFAENGYPKTTVISIEKINFMMKSDIAWWRVTYGKNQSKVVYQSTSEPDFKTNDIISDREKDVLRCLAAGIDTQEISKILFISTNTIIKHRKNMLARTGLCDTTALIQICQACSILN